MQNSVPSGMVAAYYMLCTLCLHSVYTEQSQHTNVVQAVAQRSLQQLTAEDSKPAAPPPQLHASLTEGRRARRWRCPLAPPLPASLGGCTAQGAQACKGRLVA